MYRSKTRTPWWFTIGTKYFFTCPDNEYASLLVQGGSCYWYIRSNVPITRPPWTDNEASSLSVSTDNETLVYVYALCTPCSSMISVKLLVYRMLVKLKPAGALPDDTHYCFTLPPSGFFSHLCKKKLQTNKKRIYFVWISFLDVTSALFNLKNKV